MKRAAQLTRFDFGMLYLVIVPALIWISAWAVTDVTRHLNVSAIRIADVQEGEQIHMDVVRTVTGRWHGAYRVTIRNVDGGYMVCTTGDTPILFSQSNNDGTPRLLPDPVTLKWWADGGTCSDDLAGNTLPVGTYSVETCHARRYLMAFYKWHCWPSVPIFEVRERAA